MRRQEQRVVRSTMNAESEDVVEDSLDEIDEERMTQPVPKLVRVFYYNLWRLQQGFASTLTVRVMTPSLRWAAPAHLP